MAEEQQNQATTPNNPPLNEGNSVTPQNPQVQQVAAAPSTPVTPQTPTSQPQQQAQAKAQPPAPTPPQAPTPAQTQAQTPTQPQPTPASAPTPTPNTNIQITPNAPIEAAGELLDNPEPIKTSQVIKLGLILGLIVFIIVGGFIFGTRLLTSGSVDIEPNTEEPAPIQYNPDPVENATNGVIIKGGASETEESAENSPEEQAEQSEENPEEDNNQGGTEIQIEIPSETTEETSSEDSTQVERVVR